VVFSATKIIEAVAMQNKAMLVSDFLLLIIFFTSDQYMWYGLNCPLRQIYARRALTDVSAQTYRESVCDRLYSEKSK
jgi:hypothetical protein